MKFMDYTLVEGLTKEDMQKEIQKFLDDGWKLEGSLQVIGEPGKAMRFFQPMVKQREQEWKVSNRTIR